MISDDQLIFIRQRLALYKLSEPDLLDDLVDHFCCVVEEHLLEGMAFDQAFDLAFTRISPNGPKEIEKDLVYLLTLKRKTMLRKTAFIAGYLSLILIISGILFIPFFQNSSPEDNTSMDQLAAISGVSMDNLASLSGLSIGKAPQLRSLQKLALQPDEPSLSESFWMLGFALFLLTVVPFWFYRGYQKSIIRIQKD